jgi:hypothetical protein
MKRKILLFSFSFLLSISFIVLSCHKEFNNNSNFNGPSIQPLRVWFDSISKPFPKIWSSNKYYLDWNNTVVFNAKNKKRYLTVPFKNLIYFSKTTLVLSRQLLIQLDEKNQPISASVLETFSVETYLKQNKKFLAQNFIDKTLSNFTGSTILWDIAYKNPSNNKKYLNGIGTGEVQISTENTLNVNQAKNSKQLNEGSVATFSYAPPPPAVCNNPTYWFLVTYDNGIAIDYEYLYTSCDNETPTTGGGGSNWANYVGVIGSPNLLKTIIIPDSSILKNPNTKCVWDSLQGVLKDILASFDNNKYDITFTLGSFTNPDVHGSTKPSNVDGTAFITTININDATDPDYSRIWLAKTFIHEAFHAKLRQKAFELIGSDNIATWPKNIDDMTLQELTKYFYDNTTANHSWDALGHDWMANNINICANDLKSFVQKYYPTQYGNIGGNDLNNYIAFFYMGLENSNFYSSSLQERGWTQDSLQNRRNSFGGVFMATNCPGQASQQTNNLE